MIFDALDIHVVEHCNNNCKYCCNSSNYIKTKIEHDGNIYNNYLKILKEKKIEFNYLFLIGGEPFLHSNLLNFIQNIKKDLNFKIKLWTNAILIKNHDLDYYKDIYNNIDILSISVYPSVFQDGPNNKFLLELKNYINNNHKCEIRLIDRSRMNYMGISKKKIKIKYFHCQHRPYVLHIDGNIYLCNFLINCHYRSDYYKNFIYKNEKYYLNIYDSNLNLVSWLKKRQYISSCQHCLMNFIEEVNFK
jgi:sulfatase maturation enzyme AslB (radical SAM superfamily)